VSAERGGTAALDGLSAERVRTRATELVTAVPAWAWLTVLVGGSCAIRAVLALHDPSPWIFQDELLYSELAKSFAATGHFAVREVPVPGGGGFGLVYPTVVAPAWALFHRIPTAYAAAKVINALAMSLAAIPVYLLARRLTGKWLALAASVLALALPGMVYTGVIMTENAFYPVFLFWMLALVLALERPTLLRQLAAVGLSFVAYLTRNQGVVLLPALVTAILLLVVLEASSERPFLASTLRKAKAYGVTWLTLAIGAVGFLVVEVGIKGRTLSTAVLGGYSVVTSSTGSVHDAWRWFLYHLGEMSVAVGILPFAAFILLAIEAVRRTPPSREHRVFAVSTLSATVWLVAEVAAFAATPFGGQILERNAFYVEPLFLIALVAWVDPRFPHSRARTVVAALVAAVLACLPTYDVFLGPRAVSNAFGLLPLWRLEEHGLIAPGHLHRAVIIGAVAAALVFVLLPRRFVLLAPALVLVYLAWANSPVEGMTNRASQDARAGAIDGRRNWIDRVAGTKPQVAAIWTNTEGQNPVTLWINEFFNRSIGPVYNLIGPPDGLPEATVGVDPSTGKVLLGTGLTLHAPYVLTDRSAQVAGVVAARDVGRGMTLYRAKDPIRLTFLSKGIYPDAWSAGVATYDIFGCRGGSMHVTFQSDPATNPHRQSIVAYNRDTGAVLARTTAKPGHLTPFSVPLPKGIPACHLSFSITPTAIPDLRTRSGDTRVLGTRFLNPRYVPPSG
jgi:hypothetical protein